MASLIDAQKRWHEVQPAVDELIGAIAPYATLFPSTASVVDAFYSFFCPYQQNQKGYGQGDEVQLAITARDMIGHIASQINAKVVRANDVKNTVHDENIKNAVAALATALSSVETWLLSINDPFSAAVNNGEAKQRFSDIENARVTLENLLKAALDRKDSAQSVTLYKSYIDAAQVELQVNAILLTFIQGPNVFASYRINLLIESHTSVMTLARDTLKQQYFGPVKLSVHNPRPHVDDDPASEPVPDTYTYFYRGVNSNQISSEEQNFEYVLATMKANMETEIAQKTQLVQALEQDHRKALEQIKLLL